ncbi:MAG: aspartate carbamoyltransferase [Candidatus Poribacteria bacterium]
MRDVVTLDDLSNFEIEQIFRLADQMKEQTATWSGFCKGKILATLFFEPSTRTRLSFESAIGRLDGRALGFADPASSSIAKGETIADTARMVANYADLIAIRHNWAGSARVMAEYAQVPVINCGDGGHSHPTQGLIDLYTIVKRQGTIQKKTIGICGDLRYSRASHSLAIGVARFGGQLVHIAPSEFQMPEWVLTKLKYVYDAEPVEAGRISEVIGDLDVIYVNRLQAERLPPEIDPQSAQKAYQLNATIMEEAKLSSMIMHPLPRVNELAYELDSDPRAAYFEQSANGVPIRMALMVSLLGLEHLVLTKPPEQKIMEDLQQCGNPNCITSQEGYILSKSEVICSQPMVRVCAYCNELKD